MTEVTPHPLKTQGFHHFLFYCFTTTRLNACGICFTIGVLLVAFFLAKKRLHIALDEPFSKYTGNYGN